MEILLNPGPVNISDRVRRAMLKPDICHREEEFSRLQNSVRDKLAGVYGLDTSWAAVLLTGSGTAAMEAMLSSLTAPNDHVLVLENGVYGERMSKIFQIHGIRHSVQHHDWEQPIDLQALAKNLESGVTHLAVVHHETTTGRLNNICEIASLASQYRVPILLDGVSSFGAEEIQFENWNISGCAATANKCLHGVPGISFVIIKRTCLEQTGKNKSTLYLDLLNYLENQDNGGTPFTQSIQVLYALNEALDEHSEMGGWKSRQQDYRSKMALLNKRLFSLDIKPLIEPDATSCVLNTFLLPDGMDYGSFHDYLKQKGFVIYSGQGELSARVFRISLMGTVNAKDIERLAETIGSCLGE